MTGKGPLPYFNTMIWNVNMSFEHEDANNAIISLLVSFEGFRLFQTKMLQSFNLRSQADTEAKLVITTNNKA